MLSIKTFQKHPEGLKLPYFLQPYTIYRDDLWYSAHPYPAIKFISVMEHGEFSIKLEKPEASKYIYRTMTLEWWSNIDLYYTWNKS